MHKSSFLARILVWWIVCSQTKAFALPRTKEYRGTAEMVSSKDGSNTEPSCDELKAMWRFSKRQSRAAEITNEIPTYRDPFSYNVWEPYYARSRSIGGMRMGPIRGGPIYGRIVHKPPPFRITDMAERNRAFEEVARMYGNIRRVTEPRRRMTAFRLGGGHVSPMALTPQSGSFQHLKELIRTERARELQKQRMAEEAAARQAAIKELSGHPEGGGSRVQSNLRDMSYLYDTEPARDAHENLVGHEGVLAFPDLLAPASAARVVDDDSRFPDYYTRDRHSSSIFDSTSSFNNEFDGILF